MFLLRVDTTTPILLFFNLQNIGLAIRIDPNITHIRILVESCISGNSDETQVASVSHFSYTEIFQSQYCNIKNTLKKKTQT